MTLFLKKLFDLLFKDDAGALSILRKSYI